MGEKSKLHKYVYQNLNQYIALRLCCNVIMVCNPAHSLYSQSLEHHDNILVYL